jgi:hypothetical protein
MSLGALIALVEGIFVVAGSLSKWVVAIVALGVLFAYFSASRESFPPTIRIGMRIVAFSQALVVFVPALLFVVEAAAITALVIIAVLALAALTRGRR